MPEAQCRSCRSPPPFRLLHRHHRHQIRSRNQAVQEPLRRRIDTYTSPPVPTSTDASAGPSFTASLGITGAGRRGSAGAKQMRHVVDEAAVYDGQAYLAAGAAGGGFLARSVSFLESSSNSFLNSSMRALCLSISA